MWWETRLASKNDVRSHDFREELHLHYEISFIFLTLLVTANLELTAELGALIYKMPLL
jgi:hypothetical protein